jgi:serine/threonine protein kinase
MGTVYRALDPTIGRTVAIKAIRLTEFADPAERERVRDRLLQEARAAGLLSHPNIITIYDVLEEESSAYIVMEYVEGPSLGDMLKSERLPDGTQLLRYFGQIADALDYAHRKGVIHRDIKSANILISSEHDHAGLAKISDFGISKFISQDTTHSGTMIGTPNYMSPEQIQGLVVDGRSDQFSFAVVVYEMLTGIKPFRAESLATLFYQVCKQDPAPPQELNSSLPPGTGEVIARALAKEPEGRYATCAEFAAALSVALNSSAVWHPALKGEWETRSMATGAAAGFATDPIPVVLPSRDDRTMEQQPLLSVPASSNFSERSAPPELPALPRRTRLDPDPDNESDVTHSETLRKKVLPIVGAIAAIGILAFVVARAFHSEPSAPVVERSAPARSPSHAPSSAASTESATENRAERERPKTSVKRAAPQTASNGLTPSTPLAAAVSSDLAISTQPPGAHLVIDNRSDSGCQTPCNLQLPPGRHTLTAELKGFDTARRIFTLPEEKQLTVIMSPSMGVLLVTTEPAGSTVSVDGKQYGVTPLNIRLPIGNHQLVVTNGSGRHEESVLIESDQFITRSFRCL